MSTACGMSGLEAFLRGRHKRGPDTAQAASTSLSRQPSLWNSAHRVSCLLASSVAQQACQGIAPAFMQQRPAWMDCPCLQASMLPSGTIRGTLQPTMPGRTGRSFSWTGQALW